MRVSSTSAAVLLQSRRGALRIATGHPELIDRVRTWLAWLDGTRSLDQLCEAEADGLGAQLRQLADRLLRAGLVSPVSNGAAGELAPACRSYLECFTPAAAPPRLRRVSLRGRGAWLDGVSAPLLEAGVEIVGADVEDQRSSSTLRVWSGTAADLVTTGMAAAPHVCIVDVPGALVIATAPGPDDLVCCRCLEAQLRLARGMDVPAAADDDRPFQAAAAARCAWVVFMSAAAAGAPPALMWIRGPDAVATRSPVRLEGACDCGRARRRAGATHAGAISGDMLSLLRPRVLPARTEEARLEVEAVPASLRWSARARLLGATGAGDAPTCPAAVRAAIVDLFARCLERVPGDDLAVELRSVSSGASHAASCDARARDVLAVWCLLGMDVVLASHHA